MSERGERAELERLRSELRDVSAEYHYACCANDLTFEDCTNLQCRKRALLSPAQTAPKFVHRQESHEYDGIELGLDKCMKCGRSRMDHGEAQPVADSQLNAVDDRNAAVDSMQPVADAPRHLHEFDWKYICKKCGAECGPADETCTGAAAEVLDPPTYQYIKRSDYPYPQSGAQPPAPTCVCGKPSVNRCKEWPECVIDRRPPTEEEIKHGQRLAKKLGLEAQPTTVAADGLRALRDMLFTRSSTNIKIRDVLEMIDALVADLAVRAGASQPPAPSQCTAISPLDKMRCIKRKGHEHSHLTSDNAIWYDTQPPAVAADGLRERCEWLVRVLLGSATDRTKIVEDFVRQEAARVPQAAPTDAKLREVEEAKNGAYRERDELVCALSKLFPSTLERHPDSDAIWDDDWRWIVFVNLPTGQATWHIHDSELGWFRHLERNTGAKWDGHTTPEKYNRLASLAGAPPAGEGSKK